MATTQPPLLVRSSVRKRSVTLEGHKTSVSIEDAFWEALTQIANRRRVTIVSLIEKIDKDRLSTNLSPGIRLFVLHEALAGRLRNSRGTLKANSAQDCP